MFLKLMWAVDSACSYSRTFYPPGASIDTYPLPTNAEYILPSTTTDNANDRPYFCERFCMMIPLVSLSRSCAGVSGWSLSYSMTARFHLCSMSFNQ